MAPKFTEKEWLEDFQDFVSSQSAEVPKPISENILSYVRRALNPSPWLVFLKLSGVHGVIGTLSLAICDQFGMNPFLTGFSLADFFMKFGHSVCMTLCGFLFLSLSVLFAGLLLRPEEFRVVSKNAWVQLPSLALLSLGAFLAVGADVIFGIALLWLAGALLGGLGSTFLIEKFIRTTAPN